MVFLLITSEEVKFGKQQKTSKNSYPLNVWYFFTDYLEANLSPNSSFINLKKKTTKLPIFSLYLCRLVIYFTLNKFRKTLLLFFFLKNAKWIFL